MKPILCLGLMFVLSGCGPKDTFPDLERFIGQTYASAEVTSTPLPPEPNYTSLDFILRKANDPFVSENQGKRDINSQENCWQPDGFSSRDALEAYELSALSFKGVIGEEGNYWALIQAPDASIHRVGVGRILGTNKGRIDSISKKTLSITEHLSDGLGCWQVRNVRLALRKN